MKRLALDLAGRLRAGLPTGEGKTLAALIRDLVPGADYATDDRKQSVFLTDAGLERAERLLGSGNLCAAGNEPLLAAVHCALHAETLLRRDVDYIVRGGRVLGSITLQYFFRLYPRLCGMTATAAPSAAELEEFYGLRVAVIPPHRPCIRIEHPDVVFGANDNKVRALAVEIADVHAAGWPVLAGPLFVLSLLAKKAFGRRKRD